MPVREMLVAAIVALLGAVVLIGGALFLLEKNLLASDEAPLIECAGRPSPLCRLHNMFQSGNAQTIEARGCLALGLPADCAD